MPDYIIKNSPQKGKGLFATANIPANHTIFEFVGKLLTQQDIASVSPAITANYLQIGANLYLDVAGQASFYTNHNCVPNCCIQIRLNRAWLVSIKPIAIGDELTFDYSTTSTDSPQTWSMQCKCGNNQFVCRKTITGFGSVPANIQQRYIGAGMVPDYVLGK